MATVAMAKSPRCGEALSEDDKVFCAVIDRLSDDRFMMFVDDFLERECVHFPADAAQSEFAHQHKEIHDQYVRLYDTRCEAVLKEAGISTHEFMKMCQLSTDPDVSFLVDIVASVADFDTFTRLMAMKRLG